MKWTLGLTACLLFSSIQGSASAADRFWIMEQQAQQAVNAGDKASAVPYWKDLTDHYASLESWTNAALYAGDLGVYYDETKDYEQAVQYYTLENEYWLKEGKDWGAADSARAEQLRTVVEVYASTSNPSDIRSLAGSTNLAKFEPESGVYLGLYSERDPGMTNYFTKSKEIYGKDHALYLAYCPWGVSFPMMHAQRAKEAGAGLQVGWEPSFGLDAVKDDDYVREWARAAKASGIPIFLRYACEMNGSWTKWNGDPAKYIEKFRLISNIMKEEAPNVAMVWSPADVPKYSMSAYYPGDAYVDWVGLSLYTEPYENGDPTKPEVGGTPLERLDELYSLYADRKPVMLSETGVSHLTHQDNHDFTNYALLNLSRLYEMMPKKYPRLKAITYFNVDLNGTESNNDYTLRDNTQVFAAYKRMISEPYFLSSIQQGASVPVGYKKIEGSYSFQKQVHLVPNVKIPTVYISKVEYLLNGQIIDTNSQPPYDTNIQASLVPEGSVLTVNVYDQAGAKVSSQSFSFSSQITVNMNRSEMSFDQPPLIRNGSTLVPLRAIFEMMGAQVSWDEATQTVTADKGNTVITLTLGNQVATVNGESITLNQPAIQVNNRTLVPLRFVSVALGATVGWDNGTQTVSIQTP